MELIIYCLIAVVAFIVVNVVFGLFFDEYIPLEALPGVFIMAAVWPLPLFVAVMIVLGRLASQAVCKWLHSQDE